MRFARQRVSANPRSRDADLQAPHIESHAATQRAVGYKEFLRMKLQLPAGDFRAYLFDCDGTIVDSMPLHYKAWKQTFDQWHCAFPEDLFYEWGGKPATEIVATLNQMQNLSMPVQEVSEQKEKIYFDLLPTLQIIPETLEHIEAQYGKIPFAVVSGGRRKSVIGALSTVGLIDKFPVIVGAEDYTRSKPDPEPFLTAAKMLGVAPEYCVVFEDTEMGINGAKAAGMGAVRVPGPQERTQSTK
jgi:HAD superfamily hydrolase (TIGR01509 family)